MTEPSERGAAPAEPSEPGDAPAERVGDIGRIVAEVQLAVREALLRHKRDGNPVAIWRDGRVVWIQPEDI